MSPLPAVAGPSSSIISIAGTDLSPELAAETSPSPSSSQPAPPSQSPSMLVPSCASAPTPQDCPFACTLVGGRVAASSHYPQACMASDVGPPAGRQQPHPTNPTVSITPADLPPTTTTTLSPASPTPSYVYAVPGDHCYYYYPCQPGLVLDDGVER